VLFRQLAVIGSLLLVAVVLQTSVLSKLGLPGATPDLVVVTVVAVAMALGPGPGALTGFLGGALLDIATPSDSILGLASIVLVGVGLAVGVSIDREDSSIWTLSLVAGAACGAATLGTAVLSAVLGSERIIWSVVPGVTLTTVLYGLILGRVMIPLVGMLSRRLVPEAYLD
jgi:rod shape-determining protein MreD